MAAFTLRMTGRAFRTPTETRFSTPVTQPTWTVPASDYPSWRRS